MCWPSSAAVPYGLPLVENPILERRSTKRLYQLVFEPPPPRETGEPPAPSPRSTAGRPIQMSSQHKAIGGWRDRRAQAEDVPSVERASPPHLPIYLSLLHRVASSTCFCSVSDDACRRCLVHTSHSLALILSIIKEEYGNGERTLRLLVITLLGGEVVQYSIGATGDRANSSITRIAFRGGARNNKKQRGAALVGLAAIIDCFLILCRAKRRSNRGAH